MELSLEHQLVKALLRANAARVKNGFPHLEIEHLLWALLCNPRRSFCRVLTEMKVDTQELSRRVFERLERNKNVSWSLAAHSSATRSNVVISSSVAQLLDRASILARYYDESDEASEIHVLLALLEDKKWASFILGDSFQETPFEEVAEQIRRINLRLIKDESIYLLREGESSMTGIITILFLSADPTDTSRLRLGEEFRNIDEQLTLARQRERFNLALPHLSLRAKDIARVLLTVQPQIVHFSGHGTPKGALCFEYESGQAHPVYPEALAALFKQFAKQVKCVVLNACYAENQAIAIAKYIDYVIGMKQGISDKSAIAFSLGFYQALGAGKTIEEAFEFGRIQIMLQGVPEHLVPVLIKKGQIQP